MSAKPLIAKANGNPMGATSISPADFPLGSPESRAAARAILGSINRLNQADRDALTLYGGCVYIDARMSPHYQDLENTQIYRRGKELSLLRNGPPLLIHQDPHYLRQTTASLQFEIVFKREPTGGDVLRFDQLRAWQAAHPKGRCPGIYWFIEAWKRQLPEMPCPLKQQHGRLFYHPRAARNLGVEWEEDIDTPPEIWWQSIEKEALNKSYGEVNGEPWPPISMIPTIQAVTFMGVVNGKHRCRPSSETEVSDSHAAKSV
jgi:hypothetical protein